MTDTGYWGTKWAEQAYLDGLIPACGTSGGKPMFCPNDLFTRAWGCLPDREGQGFDYPLLSGKQIQLSAPATKYSVTIYCPDTHVTYDRNVMDHKGVGGGATARVRIAYALAASRSSGTPIYQLPKGENRIRRRNTPFFQTNTRPFGHLHRQHQWWTIRSCYLGKIELESRLKILLVHGIAQPNGLSSLSLMILSTRPAILSVGRWCTSGV